MDEHSRSHGAEEFPHQRKMIVLDPRHRTSGAALRFVGHGVGESQIHSAVPVPELGAILEIVNEHVARRPEGAIGKAVVIRVHLVLLEPHPAQRVRLFAGRNLHASEIVGGLAICGARAPRDPGTVNAAHRGVECRYETTSGLLDIDAVHAANVLIWLAVRHENELAAAEISKEIGNGEPYGAAIAMPRSVSNPTPRSRLAGSARRTTF